MLVLDLCRSTSPSTFVYIYFFAFRQWLHILATRLSKRLKGLVRLFYIGSRERGHRLLHTAGINWVA